MSYEEMREERAKRQFEMALEKRSELADMVRKEAWAKDKKREAERLAVGGLLKAAIVPYS